MTTQPTPPNYLPAVNYQLEYQAGLLPSKAGPVPAATVASVRERAWLGADFTHMIVTR
jgi:hypothetical protein